MKTILRIIVVAFAMSGALAFAEAQSGKIAVYVGPQTRDGFVDVDSGVRDSIKDIQVEIQRSKRFTVARTPEAATLVVIVLGRRIGGSAGAIGMTTPSTTVGGGTINGVQQTTTTIPGVTTFIPLNQQAIDTILRVDTYERPMTSVDNTGSGLWRPVAKRVVKDLAAWVDANSAKLQSR